MEKKKRKYNSEIRTTQAQQTKTRILEEARNLFHFYGYECITIEQIAHKAEVSIPTVYAIFKSKLGILRELIDYAMPPLQYQAFIKEITNSLSLEEHFKSFAKLARMVLDAEKKEIEFLKWASGVLPELKKIEKEFEERRYSRLEEFISAIGKENGLKNGLDWNSALDIFWILTGRDVYRMLVTERGWSSDEYEQWLGQTLIECLLAIRGGN